MRATLASLLVLLAACSRHDAPAAKPPANAQPALAAATAPAPSTPAVEARDVDKARAAELMRAIFGDEFRAEDNSALAEAGDGEDEGYWRMSLYAAKELPDGRTVAVVNGALSDENGADLVAHVSPGMLSVYILRRKGAAWQVIKRHQGVGTMGSMGNIGIVKWIDLGTGKPGLIVSSGGTWFGSTIMGAQIFDIDHGMRSLGSFDEYSTNGGGCTPETEDCWDVNGHIATASTTGTDGYRDIVVDFKGSHFRVTDEPDKGYVEHPVRTVKQQARYRFNGKQYVLVSGENPVPPIG